MCDNVKNFSAGIGGAGRWPWTGELNVILIIRHNVFVDRIQSLKAYDPLKTIFQTKDVECFNSMDLVSICEDLIYKLNSENHINIHNNLTPLLYKIFLLVLITYNFTDRQA